LQKVNKYYFYYIKNIQCFLTLLNKLSVYNKINFIIIDSKIGPNVNMGDIEFEIKNIIYKIEKLKLGNNN